MANEDEKSALVEKINSITNEFYADEIVRTAADDLMAEKIFLNTSLADSLIVNQNLRELWTVRQYYECFNYERRPLSETQQKLVREKISNPSYLNYIDELQQYYENIENKNMHHEASLKNTEHLKEYTEAEALFAELIKPYEGKVIYIDFWASWCAPCLRSMPEAKQLREEYKDKEIIFIYLAFNDEKPRWKVPESKHEISYLSESYFITNSKTAQTIIDLKVGTIPRYLLFNKKGELLHQNAPEPIG